MSDVKRYRLKTKPDGTPMVWIDDKQGKFVLASDYDALRAENERLREALERVHRLTDVERPQHDRLYDTLRAIRDVIRAALDAAGKEGEK